MAYNFTGASLLGTSYPSFGSTYYGNSFGSSSFGANRAYTSADYRTNLFTEDIQYKMNKNVTYNNCDALDASVEKAAEDVLDLIRDHQEDKAVDAYNVLLQNVIDSNLVGLSAINIDENKPLSENRNLVALVSSKILTPMLHEKGGRYNFDGTLDEFITENCASSVTPYRLDDNTEEDLLRLIDLKTAPESKIKKVAVHSVPIASGAAIGATIGALGGPVGAGAGAAIGAVAGVISLGIAALIRKIF